MLFPREGNSVWSVLTWRGPFRLELIGSRGHSTVIDDPFGEDRQGVILLMPAGAIFKVLEIIEWNR